MSDNSTYRATLGQYGHANFPTWIKPILRILPRRVETITDYHAFIRLDVNYHFNAKLTLYHETPGHNPHQHRPTYAEFRLQFFEYYKTVEDFRPYNLHSRRLPRINHIYVIMPGGSVYGSRLHTPYYIPGMDLPPNS
ncbi:uncharacterized protein LOC117173301 [Belonocnema kinseyi]|uniref:uncharacterized protein LOC117173301 n=1 Tax=Belonocnema kinseyi TaxID=2817044 RepID=UPI00143D9241|nr:uncharacterized protein LOC117173301 [Belonocnema kinseyi]